ncbi:sulfatase-like hydrolase/transferase [Puniceicoccaceae bacterium K14]|nr:sulfatase-like hydrolase/transferase [Puniceicoccaceae bacterium K14]
MKKRPNVLVFLTDQQRADTIGGLGNGSIRTPVLDRLVDEGVAFTRAYTPSPVCVPARCSMATGLYPAQTGCWDNFAMPDRATSYMEALSSAGYQTHGVGKMHFTPNFRRSWGFETRDISEEEEHGDYQAFLKDQGYGHVLAPHGLRGDYYYMPQPSQLPAELHETSWVADRSISFLEERDRTRPFLLNCHFIKPHPPFENPMPWSFLYRMEEMDKPYLPDDFREYQSRVNILQNRYKYKDRAVGDDLLWRSMKAAYFGAISFVDYQIGRVLKSLGPEIDNTIVIFSSDHGEMMGDYGCVGKRCMLEAATRIPLLVRFPGSERAGLKVDTAASLIDISKTCFDLAGVIPNDGMGERQGCNLFELADGKHRNRTVFSQFQAKWMGNYMATDGKHKFMYSAADDKKWSFELCDDLTEIPVDTSETDKVETVAKVNFGSYPNLEAIDGANWRQHEAIPWPENSDYGLLRQDPSGLEQMLEEIRPYYNGDTRNQKDNLKAIFDHMP